MCGGDCPHRVHLSLPLVLHAACPAVSDSGGQFLLLIGCPVYFTDDSCRVSCCFRIAPRCRTIFSALSKVNSGSICRRSAGEVSRIPTTMRSRIAFEIPVCTVLYQIIKARDELLDGFVFFLTAAVELCAFKYHVLSYLEERVELVQDRRVRLSLLCRDVGGLEVVFCVFTHTVAQCAYLSSSSSSARPDARRNCSNRRRHLGHSSGSAKLNEEGSCKRILAIPLLSCKAAVLIRLLGGMADYRLTMHAHC